VMTEKAVKINEKLKARGKQLENVSHEEFNDIAHEVGLKPVKPVQAALMQSSGGSADRRIYQLDVNSGALPDAATIRISPPPRGISPVFRAESSATRAPRPPATFSGRSSKYTISAPRRPASFFQRLINFRVRFHRANFAGKI